MGSAPRSSPFRGSSLSASAASTAASRFLPRSSPHRCHTIESLATGPVPASGAGPDDPHARFIVLYTCKVCETRSAKSVSRQAYSSGVVLLRCDGCQKHHLFADHLGWFEDEGTDIESILAAKGVTVGRSSLNLKPEELQQLETLQKQMMEAAKLRKQRAEAEAAGASTAAGDASRPLTADVAADDAVIEDPVPRLK